MERRLGYSGCHVVTRVNCSSTLDEDFETERPLNDESKTSYDVTPQKKSKSRSKLKKVTKKIRQDAEKLQTKAIHQWFIRTFVHEMNFPVDSTDSYRSKYATVFVYTLFLFVVSSGTWDCFRGSHPSLSFS